MKAGDYVITVAAKMQIYALIIIKDKSSLGM